MFQVSFGINFHDQYRGFRQYPFKRMRELNRRVSKQLELLLALCFLFSGTAGRAVADAGVFAGNGQTLHQITSRAVQLVSIDVVIVPGRGPFLFDGGVRGMDQAEYNCTFVLRNLSAAPEDVQVGFPVDSQFAQGETISEKESKGWVLDYGFIARDESTTYHVQFVRRKPGKGPDEFSSVFVWKMHFRPKEKKTLSVQYHIPISMGLVSTLKDQSVHFAEDEALSGELMETALLEFAGYITSTGSSWAGKVEDAKFTVVLAPFERYLEQRGVIEERGSEKNHDEALPVRHPFWFREITPKGFQEKDGKVQWQYKNFKPRDPIQLRYYLTQFPKKATEVDVFADRFLKGVGSASAAAELRRLREIILATYGKEPDDGIARSFASQQVWYEPRKDFSSARLNDDQRAVLVRLDQRIEQAQQRQ